MKRKAKKYILKHDFPFIEFCGIGMFLFLLGGSINAYLKDFEIERLYVMIIIIIGLTFCCWLTISRNKTIVFEDEKVRIKSLLSYSAIELSLDEIQGYRLKETFTRLGLDYHIELITKENKKFELIKDVYSNYHRLPTYLKNFGIRYLGTSEITWKYKHIYSRTGIYASIIAVALFFLVQLIKIIK